MNQKELLDYCIAQDTRVMEIDGNIVILANGEFLEVNIGN